MIDFKETILAINDHKYSQRELVSIMILTANELEINTISEMARLENKTPRGILISNNYEIIKIGKQRFAIKGLTKTNLPF